MIDRKLKERQAESRKLAVRRWDWENGSPVLWVVDCTGSCGDGKDYHEVRLNRKTGQWSCDCPATVVCIHIMAVYTSELQLKSTVPSFWKKPEDVERQHRHPVIIRSGESVMYATLRR